MKYNSKLFYNKKLPDGGAIYNSGLFTIIIMENGSGIDDVKGIISNTYIEDNAYSDDKVVAMANIEVLDNSTSSTDSISIENNVNINDLANGTDYLNSIFANIKINDNGVGFDKLEDIVGAFFVIDSNDILQPLGVLVTGDSRYELLPSTRDSIEEIPGRHGEIDFGSTLKSRLLELHVVTKEGYSPLEKARLQRLFAKYLDPTKGYKTLIFSDDIKKTYKVKYSGKIDISNYPSWFKFVIPFKMADPFVIGSFEKSLIGSGTIKNVGTHETGLTIEINGPITKPKVTIGNKTIEYNHAISSGQKLIIDTEKQTAKINGMNALGDYNGVFPMLQSGKTKVISSSNVTIRWRDKWI